MNQSVHLGNKRANALLDLIDIPPSYYEKAGERYQSVADWLHRDASSVRQFSPEVYLQGSFRYGTVVRPLTESEEYDLDMISELQTLTKTGISQYNLKHLIGLEIKAYAESNNLKKRPEEKKRCWRLDYADVVQFHMDIVPAVPESAEFKQSLINRSVLAQQAQHAIAITDLRHPKYHEAQPDWPSSNPKGYAEWFESKLKAVAQERIHALVQQRAYASIDAVPPYQWKTPLQRIIQLMKRHRDVMFQDDPKSKPISMIITTLAAHSYDAEQSLYEALVNVVKQMGHHVQNAWPRVPNPVNPQEDFADAWRIDPSLESNFWKWYAQLKRDVDSLASQMNRSQLDEFLDHNFSLRLNNEQRQTLANDDVNPTPSTATIKTPPASWAARLT